MKMKRKRKGYTLIEITFTTAVLLILISLGLAGYSQLLDNARQRVSKGNLKALGVAVETYIAENDALPASLGDLKLEYLERGYARVMEESDWRMKFSQFLVKLNIPNEAHAAFLTYDTLKSYGAKEAIFQDDADTNGGASYGMNGTLQGLSWDFVSGNTIIVASSDNYVFNSEADLAYRYGGGLFGTGDTALGITKDLNLVSVDSNDGVVGGYASTDNSVTICHDPGLTNATVVVTGSTLLTHLGHGDTAGPCN
jgi:prepilin-type N-terminal cleavage/methylation domain-containing protein